MTKRTCIITHDLEPSQLKKINEIIPDWELISGKDSANWQNEMKKAEVIAGWKKELKEMVLDGDTKLRWFQSWSAGVDSLPWQKWNYRTSRLRAQMAYMPTLFLKPFLLSCSGLPAKSIHM